MDDKVNFQHPDYERWLPDWALVEDAASGERAVKDAKEKYLPKPNETDASIENVTRYKHYLARAVYYNATGRTVSSMAGVAFREFPEIELPPAMEDWQKDVTGAGVPLIQHAQMALTELLKTARAGILVDYPATGGQVSVAEQRQGGVQPTMTLYKAADIINWRAEKRGSETVLSLVVLRESYEVKGEFASKHQTQYRSLKLDESGLYAVQLWRKRVVSGGTEEWYIESSALPTQGNGQRWDRIPFQFIGAKSNDWNIDPSPMYDIAVLNLAHYRNSADYEDSCYFAGQPQFWMSGLDEQWVEMLKKMGIYVGSRQILPLPMNGQAGVLQAQPNSMPKEAMDQKERQMAALGARLLTRGSGDSPTKTATEIDSDDAAAHSVLSLCCDNVSMAYSQCMRWAANFAKVEGEISMSIPTDFMVGKIDAPTMTAMMKSVQAGLMPLSDFWTKLREAGFIDSQKTDDQIREEIDTQPPPASKGALEDEDEQASQDTKAEA